MGGLQVKEATGEKARELQGRDPKCTCCKGPGLKGGSPAAPQQRREELPRCSLKFSSRSGERRSRRRQGALRQGRDAEEQGPPQAKVAQCQWNPEPLPGCSSTPSQGAAGEDPRGPRDKESQLLLGRRGPRSFLEARPEKTSPASSPAALLLPNRRADGLWLLGPSNSTPADGFRADLAFLPPSRLSARNLPKIHSYRLQARSRSRPYTSSA